jgi:hypothetical protein
MHEEPCVRLSNRNYHYGVRIGRSTVSTGSKGHPTPTGIFTILQKREDYESTIYKGAKMPQYAPGKTASPGFLLSGITGEAPSRHLPAGGFEWQPDKSPEGAVSIIISIPDSIAYVYRNSVQTRLGVKRISVF